MFLKGPSLYAFKGLAGRFAPIGVHLAMLLIMVGGTLSATGSFRGSVTVPQGLNFVLGDVLSPSGFLSKPTKAFDTEVHVNRFYMDYYDSGEVVVFFSFKKKVISFFFVSFIDKVINRERTLCSSAKYRLSILICLDKIASVFLFLFDNSDFFSKFQGIL